MQDASDLGQRVETALVDAVAKLLQLLPRFRGFEILGPERKRPALAGSCGVDGAPVLPEDTVAVRLEVQYPLAVFLSGEISLPERAHAEPEKSSDALDLARADVDPARLGSAAAVIALMARESEALGVPRGGLLFPLGCQDATL